MRTIFLHGFSIRMLRSAVTVITFQAALPLRPSDVTSVTAEEDLQNHNGRQKGQGTTQIPSRILKRGTAMVIASELRPGMIIRIEGQVHKILEVESKAGAAKMGGVVKAKLINVKTGRMWEPHFRPQEKLDQAELERHVMEFLYRDSDNCTFMRGDTFEQIAVPVALVGAAKEFLQPGMEVPIEFSEGEPVNARLPDSVEVRVSDTATRSHTAGDSAWKEAILQNGVRTRVPLFIGVGDMVRVEMKTGRYIERGHMDRKRSA